MILCSVYLKRAERGQLSFSPFSLPAYICRSQSRPGMKVIFNHFVAVNHANKIFLPKSIHLNGNLFALKFGGDKNSLKNQVRNFELGKHMTRQQS